VTPAPTSPRMTRVLLIAGEASGDLHGAAFVHALSERLPLEGGRLQSVKLAALGMPKPLDMPEVEVILIQGHDPEGPYGAKGVGEIGCIPTAAAVANAFYRFDGRARRRLPLDKPKREQQ